MEKRIHKKPPLLNKLKRLIVHKSGRNMHKLYPDKYYERIYLTKEQTLWRNLIAKYFHSTKRSALNRLMFWGMQHFMDVLSEIEERAKFSPEDKELQDLLIQFRRATRRISRQQGWNVNKLFPLSRDLEKQG